MIHISLSPNLEKDDVLTALGCLFFFWKWKKTRAIERLEHAFLDYFNNSNTYLFNSGRSGLYVFLKSLNLEASDEIILQAFTCNAVANPILWAGGKPVYTDIDETYNIDPKKLESKINKKTKAIIIQHTFGIPAKIDEILTIAEKNNILIIEDCAHALGASYKEKKLGKFGDVALFSFGRDKAISSVYGGVLMINNESLLRTFIKEYSKISMPSLRWTLQQLMHPLITYFVLATYSWLGKYVLYGAQHLRILSYAVAKSERYGKMPSYFPALLPNPLAYLALKQFYKLDKFNAHRRELAGLYEEALKDYPEFKIIKNYDKGAIFLRYPLQHKMASDIFHHAKERGYILGDWYREVIAPADTKKDVLKYYGTCQYAEEVAPKILNLPTNIRTSRKDAKKIIDLLLRFKNR